MESKKLFSAVALGVVGLALILAVLSFLRENWAASETPGAVESFLASWLRGGARPPQENLQNPLPPTEQNLQEGRRRYEEQCAFCHGLDGRGQQPTGRQFYPPVPSLVDEENELADGQIHYIVTHGIRYTAMPSFAKVANPEEIWKIVLWVRHLAEVPPRNPSEPPAETRRVIP